MDNDFPAIDFKGPLGINICDNIRIIPGWVVLSPISQNWAGDI